MLALWLDDEPQLMRPQLEGLRRAGVEVVSCTSVNQAIKLIEGDRSFDAVITDIMMPSFDGSEMREGGVEFARRVKSVSPLIPVAAYSAFTPSTIDNSSPFDQIFSKGDFSSAKNSLLAFVHDSISARVSASEGLDEEFVKNILTNEDFKIVSDLENDGIVPGTEKFARCVEISYEVNDLILSQASRNPEVLWEVDDRKFEEICATVLCREGYRVHLTSKSGDGGFDLMAFNHDGFLTSMYLIECKRWHPQKKRVGVPIVRQLNGVVEKMSAHGGLVMTTSEFTSPAKEFASEPTVRMDLVDFLKLRTWMEKVRGNVG